MKKSTFLKATAVATVLLLNTSAVLAADTAKESITTKHTVGEKFEDTNITTKVKMALLIHRSTATFRTEVITTDGVVSLTGNVKNNAEKELITKLVEDVHGVKSVKNNITVVKSDSNSTALGEKLEDSLITSKVKMVLVLNRSTGALRTSVSTTDSVVTVSGVAKNSAEKELVSKVVEDVDGVKSVVNTMTVE